MHFIRGGSLEKQLVGGNHPNNRDSRGGSLERKFSLGGGGGAWSDSEYGRMLGSPMASRRNGGSPNQTHSPNSPSGVGGGKRDPVFGSRSLPKGTSGLNYGLMMDKLQQKRQQRQHPHPGARNDGSVSDSNYATFNELRNGQNANCSPYSWLQPASTYAATVQDHFNMYENGGGGGGDGVGGAETASSFSGLSHDPLGSSESLNSVSSSIQQARANSLTKARLMMHQRNVSPRSSLKRNGGAMSEHSYGGASTCTTNPDTEYYGIPVLQRENSAGVIARFKSSQATSPTKPQHEHFSPMSNKTYAQLPCYGNGNRGAAAGSIYQTQQEAKTDAEIEQLKKELMEEHRKVANLTSQLTTNAHVVSAFEQSLANMTARLHELTNSAEKKDSELNELRRTIDRLRQSGAEAGLIKAGGSSLTRQKSTDSVVSAASSVSGDEAGGKSSKGRKKKDRREEDGGPKRSGWLRHSFTKAFSRSNSTTGGSKMMKGPKGGSVSDVEGDSITQRLYEQERRSDEVRIPEQMRPASAASGRMANVKDDGGRNSAAGSSEAATEVITELQRQLMEKETLLTETRLEALSSAHQLESLRETVTKMRGELAALKSDNDKLSEVATRKSLHSSKTSLNCTKYEEEDKRSSGDSDGKSSEERLIGSGKGGDDDDTGEDCEEKRLSVTMSEVSVLSGPSSLDLSGSTDPTNKDGGKLVTVSVRRGESEGEVQLGTISVSGRCSWELLDSLVQRLFKEYVMRVDPSSNLGLNTDSIANYDVGEICRCNSNERPEYLPYGYLVGDTTNIRLNMKSSTNSHSVDALAFETLTPKAIVKRYVSLLIEHKRIILSGPAGTGKTFMAKKLADYLVQRQKTEAGLKSPATTPTTPTAENLSNHMGAANSILFYSVQANNVSDLRGVLSNISALAESPSTEENSNAIPKVVILDNLHYAGSLDQVFNGALTEKFSKCPYIIGTLNQTGGCSGNGIVGSPGGALSPSSTTNLQLKHNFRWVLCANHIEPAKGFLGRYLRQKLLEVEALSRVHDGEMAAVIEWIAGVHARLNKLIESHSSSDVSLGPGPFLACPTDDVKAAQEWFVGLWNEALRPYIRDAVREGLQMYGKRSTAWEDPTEFLAASWPWSEDATSGSSCMSGTLVPITAKDVGHDTSRPNSGSSVGRDDRENGGSGDPLFNMLMHLQDAAAGNTPAMTSEDNH